MRHDRPPQKSEAGYRRQLEAGARQASSNPFYVAFAMDEFQRTHQLDAPALAAWLNCPVTALPQLALHRRPDPATARYRAELEALAGEASCNCCRLEVLLNETRSE